MHHMPRTAKGRSGKRMKGQIFCQRTEYLSKDRFSYLSNDRCITFLIKLILFIWIVNETANCVSHCKYLERFCNTFEKVPSLFIGAL